MEKIAILYSEDLKEYDFGISHPFDGKRFEIFLEYLKKNLPKDCYEILTAKEATDKDLLLICEKDYVEFNKNFFGKNKKDFEKFFFYHSPDNFPHQGAKNLEKAARIIVGQAKLAAELIAKGKFKTVVSIGGGLHHAKRNFGEGFCIYNDVAFCAFYLLEKLNFKRVLILDTDAHAGNGTYEYFKKDKRVLFIDLHQDPKTIYPGTGFLEEIGEGEGRGLKINLPLPKGAGNKCYQFVFEKIVEPLVEKFQPEVIIRNGGSDPHFKDYLTELGLTLDGLAMIGKKVKKLSQKAKGEIEMIASGYNSEILPKGWLAILEGILGIEKKREEFEKFEEPLKETKEIVKKLKKILAGCGIVI